MPGMNLKTFATFAVMGLMVKAQDCTRNATVVAGDTCDSISKTYAASTYQLAAVNSWIDAGCLNLEIDDEICLGVRGGDCSNVWTVVPGDTCSGIQAQFSLDDTILYTNNPQIDSSCQNIYVGEVLCVDSKIYTYPSTATTNSSVSAITPSSSSTDYASNMDSATTVYEDVMATVTASSTQASSTSAAISTSSDDVEYCDDDDDSEDCVDEDSLPYCDEV